MKTTRLLLACAALVICNAASADSIGYTETFNSGSNMNWGTSYGWGFSEFFGSTYDEDGAAYSSTGGNGGGYVYVNAVEGALTLIFADSDASNGALAGNASYSTLPSLEADVRWTGTEDCYVFFFLASTLDSSTNPVGAPNLTMFYSVSGWLPPSSDWTHFTADLTDPGQWSSWGGSGDFSSVVADVDVVGAFWYGYSGGEFQVDDFVGTPEPGLLLTMAPMAGFLGWRLRRRGKAPSTARGAFRKILR